MSKPVERVVYQITSMLSMLLRQEKPEVRQAVGDAVDDFIDQMNAEQARGVTPEHMAKGIQHSSDEMLEEAKRTNPEWPNVTCRKGCSQCCHTTVAITGHEARQLIQVAKRNGIVIDAERLKRQTGHTDQSWLRQPDADRACGFLGPDNLCRVYDDRPLSCRKYFVVSPPEMCDTRLYHGGRTLVFIASSVEILTTAAFTQSGCGFMPEMLLEALAKEEHDAEAHTHAGVQGAAITDATRPAD